MLEEWERKLDSCIDGTEPNKKEKSFALANRKLVKNVLTGISNYSGRTDTETGYHAVVNIPAVHVPDFCRASRNGDKKPYKNFYDLNKHRVGEPANKSKREKVDSCLPLNGGDDYKNIYFCAAELNGSGVVYYGDICLVLKRSAVADYTTFLDRNSFEFWLEPFDDYSNNTVTQSMRDHSGNSAEELVAAATLKIFEDGIPRNRHLTSGTISGRLLKDENYIEILKSESFGTDAVYETRTTAEHVALESHIARNVSTSSGASLPEMVWLDQRREAFEALEKTGCRPRVVTSPGRDRK